MNKENLVILKSLIGFIAMILILISFGYQITVGTVIMAPAIAILCWTTFVLCIATKEEALYTFIWCMCSAIWTVNAFNILGQ